MLDKTTRQKVGGVVYCGAWYASILTGFYYLYAPLLPLLLVHRGLYRRLTDILFAAWESFNVSLLEIVFGMQTYVGGDYIRPEENSLIIVNHRTRVDWNFLWSALLHGTSPPAHNAKLVLKDELKRVPGIGWIMQMSRFIYICRKWKSDEIRLSRMLAYLGKYSATKPFQLVLFPEGTNLTNATKEKSLAFGKANNLKPLNHLLHPRTTGFTYIVDQMRQNGALQAVYDVTIAYPDEMPLTEWDLLEGKFPKEIHFHIKRHPNASLPTTFIGLEKWLQELWRDKDQLLEKVYKDRVRLPVTSSRQSGPAIILPLQYVSLAAWMVFTVKTCQMLLTTWAPYHWLWILTMSSLIWLISLKTDGLQELEVILDNGFNFSQIAAFFLRKPKQE